MKEDDLWLWEYTAFQKFTVFENDMIWYDNENNN